MPGFGTPFARPFGGGPSIWQQEIQALLDAYAPGWDSGDTTQNAAEVHALALAVAVVWAVNKRIQNSRIPSKMIESLPIWEQACNIVPQPTDSLQVRRAAVAARFLGYVGNTVAQIYELCATIAGDALVGLGLASQAGAVQYQPGISPGPPGFTWSSTRAVITLQLTRASLPDANFFDLVRKLLVELQIVSPSWMTFWVATLDNHGSTGVVPSSTPGAGVGVPGLSSL